MNKLKNIIKGVIKMRAKLILTTVLIILTTAVFAQRGGWLWSSDNVKTITGTVTDNTRPVGGIKADDGTEYVLHLGPVWYWNQNNYELSNNSITVKGNVVEKNGKYEIYPFEIVQDGKTMTFADDNGTPKWTQNRKGNRQGWRNRCPNCPCWQNSDGTQQPRGYGRGPNPNCPYRNK